MHRLQQQAAAQADAGLADLLEELKGYPALDREAPAPSPTEMPVFLPLQLASPAGVLSFISTVTVFGTPHDITLSELAMETFFPADVHTAQVLRKMAEG